MPSRHWLYFGAFVVTGILLVGAALMGVVDASSVLTDGATYGEEFLLLAMVGEAIEWIVAALVLGAVATLFLLATVVSVLRTASLPRDDRLVSIVEALERRYPILRRFDVSERFEPTVEDRKRRLEERYVAGDIDEEEFEREMDRLLDDDSTTETSRAGTAIEIGDDER